MAVIAKKWESITVAMKPSTKKQSEFHCGMRFYNNSAIGEVKKSLWPEFEQRDGCINQSFAFTFSLRFHFPPFPSLSKKWFDTPISFLFRDKFR